MGIEQAKRLDELDSLRGLAALTVVFCHFRWFWLADKTTGLSLHQTKAIDLMLMPVSAGHEAVILFFVLSGFVLSIPAVHSRAQSYPVFVIRRVFRIYLPYVAALMLAVAGSIFFFSDPSQSNCLAWCWSAPMDWHLFRQHLLFLGDYDTQTINPPIWSLVQEMRISLIFPVMCALVLKLRPAPSLVCAFSISAVSAVVGTYIPPEHWAQPLLITLHYAGLFVIGIYLARQRKPISTIYGSLSVRTKIAIAFLSVLLYVYGGRLAQVYVACPEDIADCLTACGAAGLIVLSLNSVKCRRALLWGPIHLMGRMSYSIYLLHFILLLALIHLLYGKLPLVAIFAICLPVVLAVSYVFYRFVERPSIQLGRTISQRVSQGAAGYGFCAQAKQEPKS